MPCEDNQSGTALCSSGYMICVTDMICVCGDVYAGS